VNHDWRAQALAADWPEGRVDAFLEDVRSSHGEVLLVTADVLVLRIRGARLCTYRDQSPGCLARARKAMEHLDEYVRPPEYSVGWCDQRGCDKRVPCTEHAGGGR
jgi:hypothetical protein